MPFSRSDNNLSHWTRLPAVSPEYLSFRTDERHLAPLWHFCGSDWLSYFAGNCLLIAEMRMHIILVDKTYTKSTLERDSYVVKFNLMTFRVQVNVLHMMVANVIWPFQRFGLAGCLVVFVYWPIALPFTCIVNAIYYLPTVYLTVRMFFYSKRAFLRYATH